MRNITVAVNSDTYRVLLTRTRQGMIIFIPKGDKNDPTISPEEFDATAGYLLRCGVTPLSLDRAPEGFAPRCNSVYFHPLEL